MSLYELAGELVRFLLRSGRDYSASGREDEKDDGILKSFFRFGFTSASPQVGLQKFGSSDTLLSLFCWIWWAVSLLPDQGWTGVVLKRSMTDS